MKRTTARSYPSPPTRFSKSRSSIDSYRVKALILTGPTASGKTELLDAVFGRGAFPLSGVVISADSMQAYRGMDIGTAKPPSDLRSRLPHLLLDIKDPNEQYTAGEFARLADDACRTVSSTGHIPIVSGGTGFYIRSLLCGPATAPPASAEIRLEVAAELQARGAESLRAELGAADPASAARIHPNDTYRLTRAVEILRITKRPPSDFAPSPEPREDMDFLVIGVERPRAELGPRIRMRVRSMMESGLCDEVEGLKVRGYGASSPGMKAIGYREFFELEGADTGEIEEAIILHSIQYAKRQMTFLKALPGMKWIEPDPEILRKLGESFFL